MSAESMEKFAVRVIGKREEATGICSFELASTDGKPLPPFEAGAHIDVARSDGVVRQYSLCNEFYQKSCYVICVHLALESRGGSKWMHEQVQVGTMLMISPPKNHFPLVQNAKRSLLFAGGIGITPILAMAEELSAKGRDFELHYCGRSLNRMAYVDRLRRAKFVKRVYFHLDDGPSTQRLDLNRVLKKRQRSTHIYVCGPAGFMDAVFDTAIEKRWGQDQLHREYFSAKPLTEKPVDFEFYVEIAKTGRRYKIPPNVTITAVLRQNGIVIPTSCEEGVCGTCITGVISGRPDHRDSYLSQKERALNTAMLPCCSRSLDEVLVLDL